MTWSIPDWWSFVLLALAVYRVFRLIGYDTILDRPRAAVVRRMGEKTETLITCAFCAGFWIALAFWLAWIAWPHWTLVVATPLAISAVAALVFAGLDPD